jgi:trehalose 6-phosphate synthase
MVTRTNPLPRPGESLPATTSRLILVSNRGPVEHSIDEAGRIRRNDAGGGVAVALGTVARQEPVTWIAAANGFADRVVALAGKPVPLSDESELRLINLPDKAYHAHYHTFCNPLLWFIQHSLADELHPGRALAAEAIESWETGYRPVNRIFADAVIDEMTNDDGSSYRVMLHDYHLYLAPRQIRTARPQATLQQFVHIPWPAPEAWLTLPDCIVRGICDGLLANDSIGFQTDACVENFLATCRAYLGGQANVSERQGEVRYLGHVSNVWANPISVDLGELKELAAAPAVSRYKSDLAAPAGMQTIVRVDRLDPSKNVLRGFQAYERLLDRAPELRGRVRFLAYLVPSRAGIPEYDSYADQVFDAIAWINQKYGTAGWQPITVFNEQNRPQALAGLAAYDVLLVNSVADGMNLVSKEGPAINERAGALVLSVTAGSYLELERGAIGIDPLDIEGTAAALYGALNLTQEERETRATYLRHAVEHYQLHDWLRHQLKDLAIAEYVKALQAPALGRMSASMNEN